MKINNFTGGLNLRVHPTLINIHESQTFHNCDNSLGSLTPLLGHGETLGTVSDILAHYIEGNTVLTATKDTYFHELNGVMYYTNNLGAFSRDTTNVIRPLGIHRPTTSITTTAVGGLTYTLTSNLAFVIAKILNMMKEQLERDLTQAEFISAIHSYNASATINTVLVSPMLAKDYIVTGSNILDVSGTHVQLNDLKGTYRYVYTYYNTDTCVESPPSIPSAELYVEGQKVDISNIIPSTNPLVNAIRIYRIGGHSSTYILIDTLQNVKIDNYSDSMLDDDILSQYVLESTKYQPPIEGLLNLVSNCGRLWASKGTKLYYSMQGKYDYWDVASFFQFNRDITGIAELNGFLVVFTKYETYTLTGNDTSEFVVKLVNSHQGCINHRTIKPFKGSLIWASADGICTYGGTEYVTVVTRQKLGNIKLDTAINGEVYDECYYLSYSDNKEPHTLVLDYRYQRECFRTIGYTGFYLRVDDELLIGYGNQHYVMFTGKPLTMRYISPILVGEGYSQIKHYKDLYLHYGEEGKFTIKADIHTARGWIKGFSRDFSYELNNSLVFTDGKSVGNRDAYGIRFDIEGTTTIHEIEFKTSGRLNSK